MNRFFILISILGFLSSCSFLGLHQDTTYKRKQDPVELMSVEDFLKNPIALRKFDRIGNCYVKPTSSQLWCSIYSITKDENFRSTVSCKNLRGLGLHMSDAAQEGHCN